MTYFQKTILAVILGVLAYFFVPAPAKAVATLFAGMLVGYFWAMKDKYD